MCEPTGTSKKSPEFKDLRATHLYFIRVCTRAIFLNYIRLQVQGGVQNVIPLIVHVTHFYYYKNI